MEQAGDEELAPSLANPAPTLIDGWRIIIRIFYEHGSRYLRQECLSFEHLLDINLTRQAAGPGFSVPQEVRPMLHDLGLGGIRINWAKTSKDMVFLCGWDAAVASAAVWGPDRIPDIAPDLADFVKRFNYVVIPQSDIQLYRKAWLGEDELDYPGDNISSIFKGDFFLNTGRDPRKFLLFLHVNGDRPLWSIEHANYKHLKVISRGDEPQEAFESVHAVVGTELARYSHGYEVFSEGPYRLPRNVWLRDIRIVRDEDPQPLTNGGRV